MEKQGFIEINGEMTPFTDEKNVLEVLRNAGVNIPTLCYYSDLSVFGACRMCIVEDERGNIMTSCSTPPKDGMKIFTNTTKLFKYRRLILKMLLSSHCRECTTCPKSGDCMLQELAKRFAISEISFDRSGKAFKDELPIDASSKAIIRNPNKCIHCGDCVRMCSEVQNVGAIDFAFRGSNVQVTTAYGDPIATTNCVNCGQCAAICPTGAIDIKSDIDAVWDVINDKNKRVMVQVAPAVRVALGERFGIKDNERFNPILVAALRKLGFDEIYDTSFGADLTVIEESNEFIDRLENGGKLPLFSSCCPGWIKYAEDNHPELLENISTCRSPMEMFSSVVKEEAAISDELPDKRTPVVVAIMPCTAKKYEADREEFKINGESRTDYVLTTQELVTMIKQAGIVLASLDPEAPDINYGMYSGAGVIFGVSGGVTEAVIRRLVDKKDAASFTNISFSGVRGLESVKEVEIPYKGRTLKIAMVSGLGNTEKIIKKIESGEAHYDFVEVMACPSGCIGGGGQPRSTRRTLARRSKELYANDKISRIRHSDANPFVGRAYREIIKDDNHRLLHVHYAKED